VSTLCNLSREEREKLNPFPLISPITGIAEEIKYRINGGYLVAKPYDKIYGERSQILLDMEHTFTKMIGARGTLIIGPKASGKTHLLAIEMDYARNFGAKIILINEKEYSFVKTMSDAIIARIPTSEVSTTGLIRAICERLEARSRDEEGFLNALKSKGYDKVQIVIDDLYESEVTREVLVKEVFTLFKLQTNPRPPIIRVSVAIHTSEGYPPSEFFSYYANDLRLHITEYSSGEQIVRVIIENMLRGEVISGATIIPIVTDWVRYVNEEVIEEVFEDFFEKYVSIVEDQELRNLKLRDLVDESFIVETVLRSIAHKTTYREFAAKSREAWLTFNGEKLRGGDFYVSIIEKYRELVNIWKQCSEYGTLNRFYKELLESVVRKVMELKGAGVRITRRYIITEEGGERRVKWRMFEYYVLNGSERVLIVPSLVVRRSGVVIERPLETMRKVRDILEAMKTAHVAIVITEDIEEGGIVLKEPAIYRARYSIVKMPKPDEASLKYFYAAILSNATKDPNFVDSLIRRRVKFIGEGLSLL